MTPARFRWGMLLILIGTLWLLRNSEVLNDNFWADLLIYLPVVLIAVGIEKIFTRSRLSFISYLTTVFLFAGAVWVAFAGSLSGEQGSYFSKTTYRRDLDPDVQKMRAVLDLEQADLTIRDSGDDLIYGRFDKYTRKPDVDYVVDGDLATVTFSSRPRSYLGGLVKIDFDEREDWYLRFARDIPLELECTGYQSDLHLNFATTPLRKLNLDADESRVYLLLGDQEQQVEVHVAGEDSNLRLRVPQHVGLRVFGKDYRTYLERLGLSSDNGSFTTASFDSADSRIELELDERLGSFSIDFF